MSCEFTLSCPVSPELADSRVRSRSAIRLPGDIPAKSEREQSGRVCASPVGDPSLGPGYGLIDRLAGGVEHVSGPSGIVGSPTVPPVPCWTWSGARDEHFRSVARITCVAPVPCGPAHERVHGRQAPHSRLTPYEPFATLLIGDVDQAHGDAVEQRCGRGRQNLAQWRLPGHQHVSAALLILQSAAHPELARRVARGAGFVDVVNGKVREAPSRSECDRGLA